MTTARDGGNHAPACPIAGHTAPLNLNPVNDHERGQIRYVASAGA